MSHVTVAGRRVDAWWPAHSHAGLQLSQWPAGWPRRQGVGWGRRWAMPCGVRELLGVTMYEDG
eukprot:1137281-Pelagomonas_calceolata.AAC.3